MKQAYIDSGLTISSVALNIIDDHALFGFSLDQLTSADVIHISVYNNPVRYRFDGTVVTNSNGFYIAPDNDIIIEGNELIQNLSFIRHSLDAYMWVTLMTYGIVPDVSGSGFTSGFSIGFR